MADAPPVHWAGTQGRILAFLHQYIDTHGYPPSIREIATAVRLTSTASVAYELQDLEARGHIARTPGVARGIVILTTPEEPEMADGPTEEQQVLIRRCGWLDEATLGKGSEHSHRGGLFVVVDGPSPDDQTEVCGAHLPDLIPDGGAIVSPVEL